MNTSTKGKIAELEVAQYLLQHGWTVSVPITDARYDLIAERKGKVRRIQIKGAKSRNGVIQAQCRSTPQGGTKSYSYTSKEIDVLAVYDFVTKKCFFLPSDKLGKTLFSIRIRPTKNGQKKHVNNATDFIKIK